MKLSGADGKGLALAPVTVTPTKPLTPTHVKGFLWLDVLHKSTRGLAETTYLWNPRAANLTAQTVAFWAYIDRTAGDVDWSGCSERELGELYVRSHTESGPPEFAMLRPYLEQVEKHGWIHPASRRLIDLWRAELRLLGVDDPGLAANRRFDLSAGETLGLLAERGLVLDHRRFGGPVYLDGTRWGLPLRQLVGEDGHMNYLLPVIRQLIPLIDHRDRFLLVFDQELTPDHVLLDRILSAFGAKVTRLALGRVPLGGVVRSSRYGGWEGTTLTELSRVCLEHVDLTTYRLGMRIYFIAVLARGAACSFRPDLLRRSLRRAGRILKSGYAGDDDCGEFLRRLAKDRGYVDPYRLTSLLLTRKRPVPVERIVRSVYV
jgi:hypothetical protein